MSQSNRFGHLGMLALAAMLFGFASVARAEDRPVLRIPLGRAEVVTSDDEVKTVAIAEPKTADAAVGSARTVVVNGKAIGHTSLVVYTQGGRFKVYDVDVYTPNADKQVLLHVKIAEVNANAGRILGIDLAGMAHSLTPALDGMISGGLFTSKNADLATPFNPEVPADGMAPGVSTDGFLRYVRTDNQRLQASWQALETNGDLRVLANPTLVARSGEKATFLAGGEFPVPIAQSNSGGQTTITIEWKKFGVNVDFSPTVEENNALTLKVAPEVSQVDYTNAVRLNGFLVPGIATRRTETVVQLGSGENLVIGGLKQEDKSHSVRKVPILGSIPLIGIFFSHSETSKVERELVVMVTPEIVTGSAEMPALPTDKPERK